MLVHRERREPRFLPARESQNPFRARSSKTQALAEVDHRPPDPVSVRGARVAHDARDVARQRRCHSLVGVDRKNPRAGRHLERGLLLPPEIIEGPHRHARPLLRRDGHGRVRRAAVEHDNLVRDLAHTREAVRQERLLVVDDEHCRQ